MKKKETYAQSIERLEQIVQQIDNGELDIDELAEKAGVDMKKFNRFLKLIKKSTRYECSIILGG